MFKLSYFFYLAVVIISPVVSFANTDGEVNAKKTYLEDIFIWKMSDELKLSAKDEKAFTEIHKSLNKQKSELNRQIQEKIISFKEVTGENELKKLRQLLNEYNQLSLKEFDSVKKLLDSKKFVSYLKIKSELTNKMKSMLIGDRNGDKKDATGKKLPDPKVIVEKSE